MVAARGSTGGALPAMPASGDEPHRVTGQVCSFQGQWGFVAVDDVEGDVFVHARESPDLGFAPLRPGECVELDLLPGRGEGQERWRGANVRRLSGPGGGALSGVVSSFRDGWGLITSPDLEAKLYCSVRDNPHLKSAAPVPGDEVTFDVGTNPQDGRIKAVGVTLQTKDPSQCVGRRLRGVVTSFGPGWGFATSNCFTGDVLLGRKSLIAAGLGNVGLRVGDDIEFEVAPSTKGYEAVSIAKVSPWGPPRVPTSLGGARDRSRSPYGYQAAALPQQGRLTGAVKTFRDSWGFIVSDQVVGDVYVRLQDSPGLGGAPLQPGEVVTFDRRDHGASARNNGAQAMNVQRAAPMPPALGLRTPLPPAASPMMGAPHAGKLSQAAGGMVPAAGATSQHMGTLVQFKDGWGWLRTQALGSQVFFGMRDNPHLESPPNVGDQLLFELGSSHKGRYRALNASISLVGQRAQGTVASMKDGWGFASSPVVEGGKNILLGKKNLAHSGIDAASLQVGDALEFELGMGPKGYEAYHVSKLEFEPAS